MTLQEFSNEFDILYNNITSNQAPGLDEYEKSVFLTKAQDEIIKAYFDPKGNKFQEGFDGSEKRQIDFSMLIRTTQCTKLTSPQIDIQSANNSAFYTIPNNMLLYINEALTAIRGGVATRLTVIPLSYTEYNRLMSKPYKRPLKSQAWRLITSGGAIGYTFTDYGGLSEYLATQLTNVAVVTVRDSIYGKALSIDENNHLKVDTEFLKSDGKLTSVVGSAYPFNNTQVTTINGYITKSVSASDTVVELIPGPNDIIGSGGTYTIRYVSRPTPIIIETLTDGLTIEGQTQSMSCQLDPIIHHEILQRAVELAKAAYIGDLQSQVALGQTSATNMGIVTKQ